MISEKLLHFIWLHQYFNKEELRTVTGEGLQIHHAGTHNHNQGPDFIKGRIQINDTVWIGNIEVHINSSDWDLHKHSEDANYNNVILHVVWKHDKQIRNAITFPTLELQSLVPKVMLQRYKKLHDEEVFVPCENFLPALSKTAWLAWKERLCVERMQHFSSQILKQLSAVNNHWEQVFWQRLARNFGIKLNSDLFEQTAQHISVNILAKHRNNLLQTEAMLFGTGNLLPANVNDDYTAALSAEFKHLQRLHHLETVKFSPVFLRMRPAAFPTIRMSQLAALITQSHHLFRHCIDATTVKELKKMLQVVASEYWNHHYTFAEVSAFQPKKLGFETTNNIIINTLVPMVFSYGLYKNDDQLKAKALDWLSDVSAEQNQFTRKWSLFNVENENAFDSQALLQLKTSYCGARKCLECAVGNQLMAAAAEPAHVN